MKGYGQIHLGSKQSLQADRVMSKTILPSQYNIGSYLGLSIEIMGLEVKIVFYHDPELLIGLGHGTIPFGTNLDHIQV